MHTLALGTFVFTLQTLPLAVLSRSRDWRHPTTGRTGARPASQFTGPGDDTITLTGVMPLEFSGGLDPIDTIAAIANSGEARMLVTGTGEVLGAFVVEGLEESRRELHRNGMPRVVDWTLKLRGVDEPADYA